MSLSTAALEAYCPCCGKSADLTALKQDSTQKLVSLACDDCRRKRKIKVHGLASLCTKCGAPVYTCWRFCVNCRLEHREKS